jgi:hypothetical protein
VSQLQKALLLAALVAACAGTGAGQETDTLPFDLGRPDVTKLSWNSRSLVAHDLDGDGLTDLIVINNDRARIDLLYQRVPGESGDQRRPTGLERWEPVLDDARFRKESVATGIRMYDLAAGDLDGDGRTDLAYTGSPDPLTILYQKRKGELKSKRVLDIDEPAGWVQSTLIADLDGDDRADLVVLTEEDLLVFTQSGKGELEGPRAYALSGEDCFGLRARDADRDGRVDLIFQVANRADALRIRFGREGGFGPEMAFRIEAPRAMIAPMTLADKLGFVGVQQRTGLISVMTLERKQEHETLLKDVRPRLFSSRVDPKDPPSYVIDDFDGDGRLDIVTADPKGARIWLRLQLAGGVMGEAISFPSLSGIRSLAAGDSDGDGRAELFLASPGERTLGFSSLSPGGRMSYPLPLPTTGKPQAVVAADLDGDGQLDLAYTHEEKKDRGVTLLRWRTAAGEWQTEELMLESIKATPRGLAEVDANQDGRLDLAVFVANDPVLLLLQQEDGSFAEATLESGFRKGLMNDIELSAFTTGDVTGDGYPEMLVAGQGYARALRIDGDGMLEVVDQYNAREADTRIAAAVVIDLDADEVPEVVLVEEGGERLEVLTRRKDGVYRYQESVPVDGLALVTGTVVDLSGNQRPDLLLFGKRRFCWWPVGVDDLEARVVATYETDLRDVSYHMTGVGDLNHDGAADIVAIDSRGSRILEILTRNRAGEWVSAMYFTLFETDPHYEGQRGGPSEPRELVITDLTGDGKDDLALLVHDRVLVYPQL